MRTWLFAPGHEARKVSKALAGDADRVVLDWEDAVPGGHKQAAREVTLAALRPLDVPALQRVAVRVGSPAGPDFAADAEALEGWPLGAVMIPKVESAAEVEAAAELDVDLVVLLESARGIDRASELAAAHPRVRWLAFGPLDLLADLGGSWSASGEEHLYGRSRVPIAARSARLRGGALDGPWPLLDDEQGLRRDSELGRRLGYCGRLLVHPRQVQPVREVYAPRPEEIERARRIVDAARDGAAAGRGALRVDGRMVDPPVIRWAERILSEAEEG
ncbi:MAG TPA: CoA ester lyase [Thermoanaerobaculia bacterium]|nr:CoA ester lyase [Thermoanaerobaculia bacterium]